MKFEDNASEHSYNFNGKILVEEDLILRDIDDYWNEYDNSQIIV